MHYVLERREAGRKTYIPVMSGENKLSWQVKDLIPNCEYYFRVKAVNKIGGGDYLELRNPIIAEDPKRKIVFLLNNLKNGILNEIFMLSFLM